MRGQDDVETIRRRMADAISEMSHYGEYDYLIINDVFDQALDELRAVVLASRLKMFHQSNAQHALIEGLLG